MLSESSEETRQTVPGIFNDNDHQTVTIDTIHGLPGEIYELLRVHRTDDEISELPTISNKDIRKALKKHRNLSGISPYETSVMICQGENCPMSQRCPLYHMSQHLEGQTCPVEERDIRKWSALYLDDISSHLQIEAEDMGILLRNMIMEIVHWLLVIRRASSYLSFAGIMEREVGFVTPNGQTVYIKKPSDMIELISKMNKRIDNLEKQLVATPEMTEKYKKRNVEDIIATLSDLTSKTTLEIKQEVEEVLDEEDIRINSNRSKSRQLGKKKSPFVEMQEVG